jgi:hypothetical protein
MGVNDSLRTPKRGLPLRWLLTGGPAAAGLRDLVRFLSALSMFRFGFYFCFSS